jgi:hypothetical protein
MQPTKNALYLCADLILLWSCSKESSADDDKKERADPTFGHPTVTLNG